MKGNNKKKGKSIIFYLSTTIMGVALLSILLLGGVIIVNSKNNAVTQFKEAANSLLSMGKMQTNSLMNSYETIVKSAIENSDFNAEDNYKKLLDDMNVLKQCDNTILDLYFASDITGMYVSDIFEQTVEDKRDLREDEWYIDAATNPDTFIISSPYEDAVTGNLIITIDKAAKQDDNFHGIISLDVSLERLDKVLSNLAYSNTSSIIAVDNYGVVLSHPDKDKIGSEDLWNEEVLENILNNDSGYLEFKEDNIDYKLYYETEELTGWKLTVLTTQDNLMSEQKNIYLVCAIVMSIIIIISLFLSFTISKKVLHSMSAFNDGVKNAAQGEFKNIEAKSILSEFIDFETNFNKMEDKIQNIIYEVKNSSKKVNNSVKNSLNLSEGILEEIVQVNNTITEIATGTQESSASLDSISGNVENLSKEIDIIKDTTAYVNEMSLKANKLAEDGVGTVRTVMEKSHATKKSTDEVREVFAAVSESIMKIGTMNESIKDITEQTNMLALNAAIEAARAGESGKGFAVVSEEIRKLAEEAAESAKEIDSIINEIRSHAEIVTEKVAETSKSVEIQEQAVNQSEDNFMKIVSSVEDLGQKLIEISNGLNKVDYMKNNVMEQVNNLSSIMEETAAGSKEVSLSTEGISEKTEECTKLFDELRNTIIDLDDKLSVFKIESKEE
ncbi:MAG: methyl-accepting chemotaxis protein [Clostridium sp.]